MVLQVGAEQFEVDLLGSDTCLGQGGPERRAAEVKEKGADLRPVMVEREAVGEGGSLWIARTRATFGRRSGSPARHAKQETNRTAHFSLRPTVSFLPKTGIRLSQNAISPRILS